MNPADSFDQTQAAAGMDPAAGENAPLTEQQIRPAAMMRDKQACLDHDRGFLLERRDRFVRVPCPACASTALTEAFTKNGFAYQWCSRCDTLMMNPRADRDLMGAFYAQSQNYAYWNAHIFPVTEDARRTHIFKPRVDRLLRYCQAYDVTADALVDVGAGFGTFAREVQDRGVFGQVIALEPTPDLAATCRSRGLTTVESGIDQCPLDAGSVDVVTAFEVIEHLFDPADLVRRALKWLGEGGLLVLSCPNVKGFDVATLGRRSNTVDHEHVNYFHPASIRLLLERIGFEVLEVATPGRLDAELVRNAALDGRIWLDDQPLLSRVLLEQWDRLGGPFQRFLADNALSSHMWACARKPHR